MEVTSSVKSPQGDEGSVVQLPQRADRFNRSVQVKKKKRKQEKIAYIPAHITKRNKVIAKNN